MGFIMARNRDFKYSEELLQNNNNNKSTNEKYTGIQKKTREKPEAKSREQKDRMAIHFILIAVYHRY